MKKIVKTPGSQKGSPSASEEGGQGRGGGRGGGGERRRAQSEVNGPVIRLVFGLLYCHTVCNPITTEMNRSGVREKFFVRQPPIGGKDDYYSENSLISDFLSNIC